MGDRPGTSYEPLESAWAVPSLVMYLAQRAGVPWERLNVEGMEGSVDGFSTSCKESVAAALETLSGAFLFDTAGFNGLVNFVPRGGEVILDITIDDMIDDGKEIEAKKRDDQITIPKVIHLEYFDTFGGLTTDKQTSDRSLASRSVSESSSQTVVIMRADDAARSVVISHKVAIEDARGELTIQLPMQWLQMCVSAVVRVNGERMRVVAEDMDVTSQRYKLKYDRVSAYKSNIKGVDASIPSTPPNLEADESRIEILDIPILTSSDDRLGYYVAVSSTGLDWPGAVVEMSRDGGASWADSGNASLNATMGATTTAMAAHPYPYPDDVSTVTVKLLRPDMELLPATMTEMLNRANLAAIGDELINFGDVEQLSEDTWRLSKFLRGRKGTAAVQHPADTRFVLLDYADVEFIDAEGFDIGRNLTFRVTSVTREGPDQIKTITYRGVSQRERAPANLQVVRISSTTIKASWIGVGKLGGGFSVGMGQFFTNYAVTYGGITYVTVGNEMILTYIPGGLLQVQAANSITRLGPAASMVTV